MIEMIKAFIDWLIEADDEPVIYNPYDNNFGM